MSWRLSFLHFGLIYGGSENIGILLLLLLNIGILLPSIEIVEYLEESYLLNIKKYQYEHRLRTKYT